MRLGIVYIAFVHDSCSNEAAKKGTANTFYIKPAGRVILLITYNTQLQLLDVLNFSAVNL